MVVTLESVMRTRHKNVRYKTVETVAAAAVARTPGPGRSPPASVERRSQCRQCACSAEAVRAEFPCAITNRVFRHQSQHNYYCWYTVERTFFRFVCLFFVTLTSASIFL